jgi:formate hydrogenlyase subunit 3/multisubunit Na+/H+ antiporter MnhD subunit
MNKTTKINYDNIITKINYVVSGILFALSTALLIWSWVIYSRNMTNDQKETYFYWFLSASIAFGLCTIYFLVVFFAYNLASPNDNLEKIKPLPPIWLYLVLNLILLAIVIILGVSISEFYYQSS